MQLIDIFYMSQLRAEHQRVRAARRVVFAAAVSLAEREDRLKATLGALAA